MVNLNLTILVKNIKQAIVNNLDTLAVTLLEKHKSMLSRNNYHRIIKHALNKNRVSYNVVQNILYESEYKNYMKEHISYSEDLLESIFYNGCVHGYYDTVVLISKDDRFVKLLTNPYFMSDTLCDSITCSCGCMDPICSKDDNNNRMIIVNFLVDITERKFTSAQIAQILGNALEEAFYCERIDIFVFLATRRHVHINLFVNIRTEAIIEFPKMLNVILSNRFIRRRIDKNILKILKKGKSERKNNKKKTVIKN